MNEDALLERIMEAQDQQNNSPRRKFKFLPTEPGYGPEICLRCEDSEVGEARREYGFHTCIHCARDIEAIQQPRR